MVNSHRGFPPVGEVFLALCERVNSPISLGLWLRFKHDQLALANFDLPVRDYTCAEAFRRDYLCSSYLSKYKGLETGLDQEAEALRKFESSESACRETNRRLKDFSNGLLTGPGDIFHIAQRKIADLLGPFSVFKVTDGVGWGPGATDDIERRRAFLDTKIREVPISVTRDALPLAKRVIAEDLHWSSVILGVQVNDLLGPFSFLPSVFSVTRECVVDTVPKNAKTHRVIAKEPRLNSFLQKGFGAYLRRRLKRVGIDLAHQEANQFGAKRAYTESLATIDLKAASDSMSIELVYQLLPVDWAMALDEIRSKYARLPSGEVIRLEKFSSMGNGFTFELETLLFWALASSVRDSLGHRGEVLVYGDDIIVPQLYAEEVVSVLSFVGFQTNNEKSFLSGNFYESCGKHYFKGEDVTPIYQKEIISDERELIRAGNRLIRWALKHGEHRLNSCTHRAWSTLYKARGATGRFQIPLDTEGDDGWCVPASYFQPVSQDINFGLKCRVISSVMRRFPACDAAFLSWSLRKIVDSAPRSVIDDFDESPYEGFVEVPDMTTTLRESRRWVMPNGNFGLDW